MLNKENIIRQFLNNTPLKLKFLGDVCYIEMTNDMLAKVELKITGTRDHYTRLHVIVLTKGQGEVDSLSFPFEPLETEYCDNPHAKNITPHVHVEFNTVNLTWYMLQPTHEACVGLGCDVADYIAMHSIGDF